jgi:hypothetical protein
MVKVKVAYQSSKLSSPPLFTPDAIPISLAFTTNILQLNLQNSAKISIIQSTPPPSSGSKEHGGK